MDKETIIRHASSLMMRYGIRSVTMEDLAKDIGISKKTLYKHFVNKADLVRFLLQEEINTEKKEIEQIIASASNVVEGMVLVNDFVEVLFQKMNSSVMYDLSKYYHGCWQILEDFHRGFIYDKIKTNLEIGVEKGWYRPEIKVEIVSTLFIEMSLNVAFIFESPNRNYAEICREKFHYHMHGIATEKGLKLFYEILSKRNNI